MKRSFDPGQDLSDRPRLSLSQVLPKRVSAFQVERLAVTQVGRGHESTAASLLNRRTAMLLAGPTTVGTAKISYRVRLLAHHSEKEQLTQKRRGAAVFHPGSWGSDLSHWKHRLHRCVPTIPEG